MRSVLLPCFDMLRGEKKSSRIRYSDGAPRGEKVRTASEKNGSFRTEIPRQGKRLLVLRAVRAENAEIGIPGIGMVGLEHTLEITASGSRSLTGTETGLIGID